MAEVAAGLANSYFSAVVLSSSGFFSKFNNSMVLSKCWALESVTKKLHSTWCVVSRVRPYSKYYLEPAGFMCFNAARGCWQ